MIERSTEGGYNHLFPGQGSKLGQSEGDIGDITEATILGWREAFKFIGVAIVVAAVTGVSYIHALVTRKKPF